MQVIEVLKEILLIGRRTNVPMTNMTSKIISAPSEVKLIASKGRLIHDLAQDYFIIYKNRFPWHDIPNIVVGRLLYDNFIVGKALEHRLSVIDATKTMVAVHQTDQDGNGAGRKSQNSFVNAVFIGSYNYNKGATSNANHFTAVDSHSVSMTNRTGRRLKVNVVRKNCVVTL